MEGKGPGPAPAGVETPSGKQADEENFPVGSWLIRRDLRPHVHAFYRFARNADDIADNPELRPDDKVGRLDRMEAVLCGEAPDDAAPAAAAMRRSLAATGLPPDHCRALLVAFRRDATKLRYRDWDDLLDYCRYSAAPVGRQVLDLHGEDRATWGASDALCAALQVINHLQDCGDDYRRLDRVYLPESDLDAAGGRLEDLGGDRLTEGLRGTIDRLLDGTARLLDTAAALPAQVRDRRLSLETAVIHALAGRLVRRLRAEDPLATRVALSKPAAATVALGAVVRRLLLPSGRADRGTVAGSLDPAAPRGEAR